MPEKVPLVLTTDEDRRIWANAERTSARVAKWPAWKHGQRRFAVQLTCCGRDDGRPEFGTWDEADAFRESYLSGEGVGPPTETRFGVGGHSRSAILVETSGATAQ